ncbi:hypothetical protein GCM10025867_03050 [Frondihabitans sucicola]|uniref:Major facilitator superfamily (MFS) profile domain-containing protein n=1 Tax=Frondihabitans sucicola TaxID=1268041 RepID=A0ABM8GI88_9MICO|nr:hypothetical protein [Frondihabitans sucicola]BDZ48064.1 hypothetical protein GCM10025867_03050 [Frondihabitans sucicola]
MSTSLQAVPRRRLSFAFVGGGLAGLLAGLDAILLAFLIVMLGGSDAEDLVLQGVGHAGWSAARGVEFGVAPGGFAILLAAMALGAVVAGALFRSRGSGADPGVAASARRRPERSPSAKARGVAS